MDISGWRKQVQSLCFDKYLACSSSEVLRGQHKEVAKHLEENFTQIFDGYFGSDQNGEQQTSQVSSFCVSMQEELDSTESLIVTIEPTEYQLVFGPLPMVVN